MERSFKVVLLGCTAVGKSSIMKRLTEDIFDLCEESTIGAAFYTKRYPGNVSLQLWDTAGQERYASLAPMYYRNADAIVAVYDVTDKGSYFKALSWLKETSGMTSFSPTENAMLVLVGNKIDYPVEDHEVSTELGRKGTKNELGLADIFMETSAKTGENVHVLFSEIAKKLAEKVESESVEDRDLFRIEPPPKLMSSCC